MRLSPLLTLSVLAASLSLLIAGCGRPSSDDDTTEGDDDSSSPQPVEGADRDDDGFCYGLECDDEDDTPGDCDDFDPDVNPNGVEICNGVDDDCDTRSDENFDVDGDGFVDELIPDCAANYPPELLDCNDQLGLMFPGNVELCDSLDNDCDGIADDGLDQDHDSSMVCGTPNDDCDDTDATINPNAVEVCDEEDNNCDGLVDNGPVGDPEFADADHDLVTLCAEDCDDLNASNFPGNIEGCDEADNDCDGDEDEDLDLDGDGSPGPYPGCLSAFGAIDCNDNDALTFPGAGEFCDLADNDCDGQVDENLDFDGDGFTSCTGDCGSLNPQVNPNAVELCDAIDNDCDGLVDEIFDGDGDGQSFCAGDCNDNNATVFIGAPELCDAIDNNCDGNLGAIELDQDGDGSSSCQGDCDEGDALVGPGRPELCNQVDDDCSGGIPADEQDDDLDGYIGCTPPGCRLALVNDSDDAAFWSAFDALDGLGLDADSFNNAAAMATVTDPLAFADHALIVWYLGSREITPGEFSAMEAWLASGGGLIVTGPNTLSDDPNAVGDDDDSAAGDDDSAPGDDDSAVGDDDSALGDDDSAAAFASGAPQNWSRLASLVRSTTWGDGPQTNLCALSSTSTPLTTGIFGSWNLGFTFTASSSDHDLVTADTGRNAVRVASVGSRAKIVWAPVAGGGQVVFWNGNEDLGDWGDPDLAAMLRNVADSMVSGCGGALTGGDCDDSNATLHPGTCP